MGQPLKALSSAVELLENKKVDALIGPQTSEEAELLAELGDTVPIISFSASSPFLSQYKNPNFIRMTTNDNFQVEAIAALVQEFGWRELVMVHEDSSYGNGIIPNLLLALEEGNARVARRTVIPPQAGDIYVEAQLYKLMALSANIFIVHMSASLASRFFLKVNELGMMTTGYGWLVTDGIVNELTAMDQSVLDSMQGVVGLRPYIPPSELLRNFSLKWRHSFFTYQHHQIPQVNVYCLWAYDSVWALATAVHHLGPTTSVEKNDSANKLAHLTAIPTRPTGSDLVRKILHGKFTGLSGEIQLKNGQLQPPEAFEIVNVFGRVKRIGFWTQFDGITTGLNRSTAATQSPSVREMGSIRWPGSSLAIPKVQRIMPKSGKRLRIGVPIKVGFKELVGVEFDPVTNATMVTGFCIDVFKAATDMLPYEVKFDFIPFTDSDILMAASYYNDLIYRVYRQQYDAAVGDITIMANRSLYVDFTIPFTETGVGMIVPIETSRSTNMWIFIQPLTADLWLVVGAFFIFTGWVVWTIEHNDNDEFEGPLAQQIGIVMWYSFSTLFFAQREKLTSNLSKVVVIVWLFVVLILTSSYTANLSSMLTVHQLQSLPKGESIGFPVNSPAGQTFLINLPFKKHSFYPLKKVEDYANALRYESRKGGVSAIIDEIPYVNLFISKYSAEYTMVEPSYYSTKGFGFAFPKGDPLVPDISAAIAQMREEGKLNLISQNWFQNHSLLRNQDSATKVARLDLYSFRGLFLITAITSSVAAIVSCKYLKKESTNSQQHEVADKPVEEKFSPVSDIPSRRISSKHIRRYSY
ncbi:glutamate receptor 2.7-like isoform X2 [Rhodamnia argentea]|uniref:Glutamate receptor n=1 Tax=Rhodamnia argentea TaxID=178133 RepID=A0A8B8PLK7_9MYRT|nr:glutamate receptor 2.7-like isoform X1 [Rhodamnia argentea]XP_048132970.1 glutamate receptor 2.7-like isoform X2 [Rhodamnia argentea]